MRADEVLETSFTQTQFRQGYDEREVDTLLDEVVAALRHHEAGRSPGGVPLRAEGVEQVRFTPTQFRRGYDQDEVDALLDRVVETLESFEAGTTPAPRSPGPSSPSSTPSLATPSPTAPTSAMLQRGERPARGVGAKVLGWVRGDPR